MEAEHKSSSRSSSVVVDGVKREISGATSKSDRPVDPVGVAIREDIVYAELGGKPAQMDWAAPCGSCCCSCLPFFLQLVMVACNGSFLFGFNLSLLNTSVDHIAWELDWCDVYGTSFLPDNSVTGCNRYTVYSSFIQTGIFIGAATGSMTSGGFLRFGRRGMTLMSMVVFVFGIITSVVSNSFSALLWARLVVGYGVGIVSVSVPVYMSEVTPKEVRGKYGVFHQLFITIGILVGTAIGLPMALTDPTPGKDVHGEDVQQISMFSMVWWRVMLGLGIIPVIMCTYLLVYCYKMETPTHYAEHEQYADAEEMLRRLYGKDDCQRELMIIVNECRESERQKKAGFTFGKAWKNKECRWVIFYGCLLSAFQQLGGINVFIASSNQLFVNAGLTGSGPTWMTVGLDALNMVMTFPAVPLIEMLGRKTLLLIGCVIMTVGVAPAAICYWIPTDTVDADITNDLAIAGCFIFIIGFAFTYGPILWVYLFEMYPTEIKGVASGLATAVNWLAGIIMVFVTSYLENKYSYTIFTVMSLIACVIVGVWMKETKGIELGHSPYITGPL